MTLLCKFCQKETIYAPLLVGLYKFEVHYCHDCSTEYVSRSETKAIHIYCPLNDKMYRWSIEEKDNHIMSGQIWYIGTPGIPGEQVNRKVKLIKHFKSGLPTITPENVERKLRFMLLFL